MIITYPSDKLADRRCARNGRYILQHKLDAMLLYWPATMLF